jgi:hypothetical protein
VIPRDHRSEFRLENSRGSAVATAYITHPLAGCNSSVPSNTSNQIVDRLMGGLIAALPQPVVHVLAPVSR